MRNRHRGATLILVIVVIGAVGLTIALLGRHFVGMKRSVIFSSSDVYAAQLLTSGQAWASLHKEKCDALAPGESIHLSTKGLIPSGAKATIKISRSQDTHQLTVTSTVQLGKFGGRQVALLPDD